MKQGGQMGPLSGPVEEESKKSKVGPQRVVSKERSAIKVVDERKKFKYPH
jgi:hypothetical protein